MNTPIAVLEDRPPTFTQIKEGLLRRGFKPEVSRGTTTFAKRVKRTSADICGWLIDNHIEECPDLSDFGLPHVDTEGGTQAGYKIIAEVLLPKMEAGEIPERPIGLMSGQDVDRAKSEFKSRYGKTKSAVFFFKKDESIENTRTQLHRYVEALENCSEGEEMPLSERQEVFSTMVAEFQRWFAVPDTDLLKMFRIERDVDFLGQLRRGEVKLGTSSWEEMASLLFHIGVALRRALADNGDPDGVAKQWLHEACLVPGRDRPYDLLLRGEFAAAYRVLDAATFPTESGSAEKHS
ncbi:MAG TPA: hypothetical protein VGB04_02210 [Allosphingosinicella sp.]